MTEQHTDNSLLLKSLTERKLWLAPLAGYTDHAFRTICKQNGADVVVSEMVSADGLIHNQKRTKEYVEFRELPHPYGFQLFGSDPEIIARAAELVTEKHPDFIDINMGCPVKKVIRRNAGSALMNDIPTACAIVRETKKALSGKNILLSVKFRSGWDFNSINALEFAQALETEGADFICVHPRTRSQVFSGKSDWDIIAQIKKRANIPVIGNGDISSAEDALRMYYETACDSIMIGRGAVGNPWIFNQIKQYTNEETIYINEINAIYKFETIKNHLQLVIEEKGEKKALGEMRAHLNFYIKGIKGASRVRDFVNHCNDKNIVLEKLEQFFLHENSYQSESGVQCSHIQENFQ